MESLLKNLYLSIGLFSGTALLSFISVYFVSKVFNFDIINPKYDLVKIRNNGKFMLFTFNKLFITFSPLFGLFFLNKIQTQKHNFICSLFLITIYSLFVEFFYFIYHYTLHSNNWLYQNIHKKHHENYDVYPYDAFYIDYFDLLGVNTCLVLPLYIVTVNYYEFLFVSYFYTFAGILVHSDYFTSHHKNHHKYVNCNYGFVFPIFDYVFGSNNDKLVYPIFDNMFNGCVD